MKKEITPEQNIIANVCKIKKGEKVLIIANPATSSIAQKIYTAADEAEAKVSLLYQNSKSSFDNAEDTVLAAIGSNPDVCFSISEIKLGKDPAATANPYKTENGETFTHIFDYLLEGKKSMRAVWTPGLTEDMFNRTVNIDYAQLSKRCDDLGKIFENAVSVHVNAPAGTNIDIPVFQRKLMNDNGDFSTPGSGGNIPAGEVFISPLIGKSSGTIVFDGSMTFSDGDSILETPITCTVENGFVSEISGGAESKRLLKTILEAENRSMEYEKVGKLPEGQGEIYKRNARNIGELGIGLNPAARITGNMLEDEKAFRTCHFAIGENYDNDAPSLIHLDGVVRNPTITITYEDGSTRTILQDGTLQL